MDTHVSKPAVKRIAKVAAAPVSVQLRDKVQELKREEILRVAGELFSSKGFTQTSVDDIAAELAIGKPQIYACFPSKIALLAAVGNRTTSLAASLASEAVNSRGLPSERLAQVVRELTTRIIEGRMNLAVLFREVKHLPPDAVTELAANYHLFNHSLSELLRQGVEEGEFDVADAGVVTHAISGMTTWIYSWYRPDGPRSLQDVTDQMVDLSLRMVLARPKKTGGGKKRVS